MPKAKKQKEAPIDARDVFEVLTAVYDAGFWEFEGGVTDRREQLDCLSQRLGIPYLALLEWEEARYSPSPFVTEADVEEYQKWRAAR